MAPGDIGAAASKASKAESLLGKAGTFSKSIAISSAENVKNIVTLPVRLLDNIGNKVADLETIFSKGKGLVVDFTKSVVVSSTKNAKSLLTKVKGTLSDVGTVSGAFAKAFGKTYVEECSKYANTCFSASRAAGAGLEAAYKGAAAGFKKAKSVLKVVKGEVSNAEISRIDYLRNKFGKMTSDELHQRINTPKLRRILEDYSPSKKAIEWQGGDPYFGKDVYTDKIYPKVVFYMLESHFQQDILQAKKL